MKRFFCFFLLMLCFALPASASDALGRSLSLPQNPQRILSLSPATTELLYALGVEERIVGVTSDCNYPDQARKKPQTGPFGSIALERIVKLKPDLIVVTQDMRPVLEPLKKLNTPVLALPSESIDDIYRSLEQLAGLTDSQQAAVSIVQSMKDNIQKLKTGRARPSVFYLVWDRPLIAAGPKSFIGEVLVLAGGQNIVLDSRSPYPHMQMERLLKQDPDILVLPKSVADRIDLNRPPYQRLKAVQSGRVLKIEDDIISRPAPRIIQALQQVNQFLYPKK